MIKKTPAGPLPVLPTRLRTRLTAMHGEAHRRYHTQAHIDALLAWLARYGALAIAPAHIEAAIWFHDAVYDPRRNDNETRSAELAERELQVIGWPDADRAIVAAMVLATQQHDAPESEADTRLFLDFDLSILGQSAARYRAYSEAIRAEYAWVDEPRYREGRRRVLQAFARRERIYFTPALHAAWDASARRNLANEIEALTEGRRTEDNR